MGFRRKSRELALQILFSMGGPGENRSASVQEFFSALEAPGDAREFSSELVSGVLAHRQEIDAKIAEVSSNWKLSRMGRVDLNVIRIAVFELFYCGDIPPRVSINEAVDIGKKYGTEKSGAFVNGILDNIYHGLPVEDREEDREEGPETDGA
ncbi:MAG: transcription antitermination factor NusB [Deltaproteobacteria bacterium]|nr:transcription antitermination factor NusB [Deltaproteobacteria bacterium]